jgi:hypothetical protein
MNNERIARDLEGSRRGLSEIILVSQNQDSRCPGAGDNGDIPGQILYSGVCHVRN